MPLDIEDDDSAWGGPQGNGAVRGGPPQGFDEVDRREPLEDGLLERGERAIEKFGPEGPGEEKEAR